MPKRFDDDVLEETPTVLGIGVGDRIADQYEVLEPLGAGGMGQVFLVRDLHLDEVMALKALPPYLASSPKAREALRREAKNALGLHHSALARVHTYGVQEEHPYLVMEYVKGRSLRDLLAESGTLELERVQALVRELAAGLEHAHARGVVHRDVKPENILLREDGSPVLIDFGIATTAEGGAVDPRVLPTAGSLAYMSPEHLRGEEATPAMDLYSLAVVAFECLAGRLPFDAEDPVDQRDQILTGAFEVPEDFPEGLERVFRRALAPLPEGRYRSAIELSGAFSDPGGLPGQAAPAESGVGAGGLADEQVQEVLEGVPDPSPGEKSGSLALWGARLGAIVVGVVVWHLGAFGAGFVGRSLGVPGWIRGLAQDPLCDSMQAAILRTGSSGFVMFLAAGFVPGLLLRFLGARLGQRVPGIGSWLSAGAILGSLYYLGMMSVIAHGLKGQDPAALMVLRADWAGVWSVEGAAHATILAPEILGGDIGSILAIAFLFAGRGEGFGSGTLWLFLHSRFFADLGFQYVLWRWLGVGEEVFDPIILAMYTSPVLCGIALGLVWQGMLLPVSMLAWPLMRVACRERAATDLWFRLTSWAVTVAFFPAMLAHLAPEELELRLYRGAMLGVFLAALTSYSLGRRVLARATVAAALFCMASSPAFAAGNVPVLEPMFVHGSVSPHYLSGQPMAATVDPTGTRFALTQRVSMVDEEGPKPRIVLRVISIADGQVVFEHFFGIRESPEFCFGFDGETLLYEEGGEWIVVDLRSGEEIFRFAGSVSPGGGWRQVVGGSLVGLLRFRARDFPREGGAKAGGFEFRVYDPRSGRKLADSVAFLEEESPRSGDYDCVGVDGEIRWIRKTDGAVVARIREPGVLGEVAQALAVPLGEVVESASPRSRLSASFPGSRRVLHLGPHGRWWVGGDEGTEESSVTSSALDLWTALRVDVGAGRVLVGSEFGTVQVFDLRGRSQGRRDEVLDEAIREFEVVPDVGFEARGEGPRVARLSDDLGRLTYGRRQEPDRDPSKAGESRTVYSLSGRSNLTLGLGRESYAFIDRDPPYDLETGSVIRSTLVATPGYRRASLDRAFCVGGLVLFSPREDYLLSIRGGSLEIHDTGDGRLLHARQAFSQGVDPERGVFLKDGERLLLSGQPSALGGSFPLVQLIRVRRKPGTFLTRGAEIERGKGAILKSGPMTCHVVSLEAGLIVVGGIDGRLYFFDLEDVLAAAGGEGS